MREEWCPSPAVYETGGVLLRGGSFLSPLYRASLALRIRNPLSNCPFALWLFLKRELPIMVQSPVCVSDTDGSGRLLLLHLLISAQTFSLGEGGLLSNCELPYKQRRAMHTEPDSQSLCSDLVVTLKWRAFGQKSGLLQSFWSDPSPSCFPELPFRLSSGHTSQAEAWPHHYPAHVAPLHLLVKFTSIP